MVDLKKQAPTIALLFTLLVFLSYSVSWVRLTIGTAMDVVLGLSSILRGLRCRFLS